MAKTAIKVNKALLEQCLVDAESNGKLANRGTLFDIVTKSYNEKSGNKSVSASFITVKVKEYGFHIKTPSKKGRGPGKSASVDSAILQQSIIEAEGSETFTTWGALFVKVSEVYCSKTTANIPGTALQSFAVKNSLNITTAKGKKGSGLPVGQRGVRVKKSEKFSNDPKIIESLNDVQKRIPLSMATRFSSLMERIRQGSRTAATKMNCLQCSNFQTSEIKYCPITHCAMYVFRPYQSANIDSEEEAQENDEDQEDIEEAAA